MNKQFKRIFQISLLMLFVVAMGSCGSKKSCSRQGKTRVPMGHM